MISSSAVRGRGSRRSGHLHSGDVGFVRLLERVESLAGAHMVSLLLGDTDVCSWPCWANWLISPGVNAGVLRPNSIRHDWQPRPEITIIIDASITKFRIRTKPGRTIE